MYLLITSMVLVSGSGGCGGEGGRLIEPGQGSQYKALFTVGTAAVSVDPTVPVYAGGNMRGPLISTIHDPLSVRVLYVSNGIKAVAFAIVDAQGWFASCQEGEEYGITGVRRRAAEAVRARGRVPLSEADIIIQATHSHAAPTVQGIWGPVPLAYLRLLSDRTVDAITLAAEHAVPAYLQWAVVDASFLNNITTAQYDSYPGWTIDGQLTVLRAVRPEDGSTIATLVHVPTHPDIVCGACLELLSADYPGVVRKRLEEKLGGVALVGPATVGRQETPVQAQGLVAMEWLAGVVESLVFEALSHATWIDDLTIGSADSLVFTQATNTGLLVLNHAWSLPDDLKDVIAEETGKYPVNRAIVPPYLNGSIGGTWLTAVRIGRLLFLSMPGEPFPEVTLTIAEAIKDADAVVHMSKAQDDLGYIYPAWVYPYTSLYPSDHGEFNVSTYVGEQIIAGHLGNASSLGFQTIAPSSSTLPTDWARGFWPGLQAMASPMIGSAGSDGTLAVTLLACYEPAVFHGHELQGMIGWDFGDGTITYSPPMTYVVRPFTVGTHVVTIRAEDTAGKTASWSTTIRVYPQVRAYISVQKRDQTKTVLSGHAEGGRGRILAWQWSFSDGTKAFGQTVTYEFKGGTTPSATLLATDASGGTATASIRLGP